VGEPPANVSVDDTVAVSQILTILLDNAARASRDHVTLAARLADNDSIDFEVCDAGPGVPASLRGLLGAAPVDSTQGGHGVGLYLAFSAAARLGGSIELTDVSEIKPRGTRAVLRLPLAREQTDAGRQGAASSNTEKQA
jgi:two-component system sensor histidine kinase RegB